MFGSTPIGVCQVRLPIAFAPLQDAQNVQNMCTELYYQVYLLVTNGSVTLALYADGPCSTTGKLLNSYLLRFSGLSTWL